MASRRPRAHLAPSALPDDAPAELSGLRAASVIAIENWNEATRVAQRRRREAEQALDRYEAALLEHCGQLRLFGGKDDGPGHE